MIETFASEEEGSRHRRVFVASIRQVVEGLLQFLLVPFSIFGMKQVLLVDLPQKFLGIFEVFLGRAAVLVLLLDGCSFGSYWWLLLPFHIANLLLF